MRQFRILVFIALCVVIFPVSAHASAVLRSGSDVSVAKDQTVDGNYYVSAGPMGKTIMSGTVNGDMYALGASVTVNGDVANDVGILAGTAQVQGPIGQDVRVVGGDVTITGTVGGDVFVIGNSLTIPSTAHINGDVFFFGNDLDIESAVQGSIYGNAQRVRINGVVAGGVNMTAAQSLTFGDQADVKGTVQYSSYQDLVRGQGSTIEGAITKVASPSVSVYEQMRMLLVPLFILLFAALSLFLLFRQAIQRLVVSVDLSFGRSLLVGLGVGILGPITAFLLLLTTLGVLIGIILLALVLLLYFLALAVMVAVIGTFTLRLITKEMQVSVSSILLGGVITTILSFIPLLGPVVLGVVLLVVIGAMVDALFKGLLA